MTGADATRPALFERFPELSGKIDWVRLETSPSPVQQLEHLGHGSLWIKRDDILSTVYGGNKVRKLEFVLADAIEKRKDRVVTMGALGTNHGSGHCDLLPPDRTRLHAPALRPAGDVLRAAQPAPLPQVRSGSHLFEGRHPDGDGFLSQLAAQVPECPFSVRGRQLSAGNARRGQAGRSSSPRRSNRAYAPSPDYVICPTASNGTMAGLSLGFMLAGLETRVIGVRVSMKNVGPLPLNTPGTVTRTMKSVHRLMARHSSSIPDARFERPILLEDYCGDGYGYPSPAGNRALEIFREREGIALDPVYTGKTCAALLDFIKEPGHADDTILYWHTYNSIDHSKEAQELDYHDLPPEFHEFFQGEPLRI